MNNIELSDEQEGILSFIQMRRSDLHGGLTAGMIAEARNQDAAEVEEAVADLIEAGLLQPVEPGARTRDEAGKPCYGPSPAGLEWLRRRDAEEDAKMIATIEALRPK
jgi:hypothetical protein